ncbi:sacsin N-terminal ATP-binding-like domain-containing protein [Geodermatophilus sp. FMUSA9-8]|uniref:sacsin N-terminal ATP-binding-like domain-containing protein n=1 Tax=Geodermatophilus sp. FMUSA9-8 TaxID=3120155 RepID=UPI00300B4365
MSDPFDTAALRRRVLAAWADSPARFREDANAEEDLVRGGYRDRLLVELAQNAADAAVRAGVPGRLRLELAAVGGGGEVLRAANTGAPLDADGVAGLASLRASAKRDQDGAVGRSEGSGGPPIETVGRFGVGFAAVLAVSDEPAVHSLTGGVRFSAGRTRAEVAAVPALAGELARREGAVPVLRLAWPAEGAPPEGFATEVVLPLRAGARAAVRAALQDLEAELLLALPGLREVEVVVDGAVRTLACTRTPPLAHVRDGDRTTVWRLAERSGELPAALLADRPVEERTRRGFTVTWAVPLDDDGRPVPPPGRPVVHAPTPSDEPLSLPARLLAPFPLGPDRRHVTPGPVTAALVDAAAAAYADLVTALPPDPAVLALVPRVGLAAAELDADLGSAVLDRLRATALLPVADADGHTDAGTRRPPGRAAVLDDDAGDRVGALTGVVPGLLPPGWARRDAAPALAALGVRRVGPAAVVEAVAGIARPPSWWARLYAAFETADREELGALPVPLADGRTAPGPAGVLLAGDDLPVGRLGPLSLRIAHPDAIAPPAARRLLERLGARPATAAAVLADPAVRAAVEESVDAVDEGFDDGDPADLADAVLALVAAAGTAPGELPWLAELALPDDDGAWAPAGELLLPGAPLAAVLGARALGTLDPDFAAAHDPAALRAAGVLSTFALVRAEDPDDLDVDGAGEWADAVLDRLPPGTPPSWPPLTTVRDLDLVADWAGALPLLAALPDEAWADVVLDGVPLPCHLRWWLATHPVLDGQRPGRLRSPAGKQLQGLYEPARGAPEVLARLRPPATVDDVLADPDAALDLLERLGDPARTVPSAVLRDVHARLAAALDGLDVEPPERVRVAPDRVADPGRERVAVLDAPWLQPLADGPLVPAGGAPGAVADLLDLPLLSERVRAAVESAPGSRHAWADLPGADLAAARLGVPGLAGEVEVHAPLLAGGRPVPWWPGTDGGPDAVDGTPAALGRALAWRHGAWPLRQALAEAFAEPGRSADLAVEDGVGC